MRKNVAEAGDLRFLLVRNKDRLVPTPPELLPPANESPGLARKVGVQVVHEAGEALRIRDGQEEVEVVGEEGEGVDLDRIEPSGACEYAEGEIPEDGRGSEQEPPLHRAAGDLEQ